MNWWDKFVAWWNGYQELDAPDVSEPRVIRKNGEEVKFEDMSWEEQMMLTSLPENMEVGKIYQRQSYTPLDAAIARLGRTGLTTEEIVNLYSMECDVAGDPYAVLGVMDPEEEDALLRSLGE